MLKNTIEDISSWSSVKGKNNIYLILFQTIDKRAAPVTTNPPTFSKHENIACVSLFGKNSDSGTKATCIKNPDCAAWQENGSKGKYCKGETKLDGWVNLKNQTGKQIVWIKGT